MTLDERAKVEALAKILFPTDFPASECQLLGCDVCEEQAKEWNALLWRTYDALIRVALI